MAPENGSTKGTEGTGNCSRQPWGHPPEGGIQAGSSVWWVLPFFMEVPLNMFVHLGHPRL